MSSRQTEYTIMIRPYTLTNGEVLPYTSETMYSPSVCSDCNSDCPSYDVLQGGEPWVEYDDENLPTSSMTILREVIKSIKSDLGYKDDYIKVVRVLPIGMIVTPVS